METIYEWLYENYYRPHAEEILGDYTERRPGAEAAERLLLSGEGGMVERKDAVNTLCAVNGTAAFAAGVYFGRHLILDEEFISSIALGGMTVAV